MGKWKIPLKSSFETSKNMEIIITHKQLYLMNIFQHENSTMANIQKCILIMKFYIHIFLRNYQFLIVPWIKTYRKSQIFIKNFNQPRISLKTFVTILYHQNTVVHINKSQIETNAYFIEDCDTEYSVLLQFTVKFG